jgi:hypothetical protein
MDRLKEKAPCANKFIGKETEFEKICISCNNFKTLNNFYISSGYYSSTCKCCSKKRAIIWKRKNADKVREYKRMRYKKNPEKILQQQRTWHENSTKEQKQHIKDYMHEYGKKYYLKNKLRIAKLRLIRDRKNANDPIKKLHRNMSRSIRGHLKKNNQHTFSMLGYTVEQLKKHLEKQFKDGMSWGNYGVHGWHIDHKIPISAFNLKTIYDIDFKRCWALSNLQPLWADDNHKKYNKILKPFQPSLLLPL